MKSIFKSGGLEAAVQGNRLQAAECEARLRLLSVGCEPQHSSLFVSFFNPFYDRLFPEYHIQLYSLKKRKKKNIGPATNRNPSGNV